LNAREAIVSLQPAPLLDLDFFPPRPIQIEVSDAPLTSDTGLLLLRQFDDKIGLIAHFAAALNDPRNPEYIEHSFLDMVRMRIFGILAGYNDQNDHDTLRTDPAFKLIANRSPNGAHLASQPTLSRFENQIDIPSLKKLRDLFINQFIASFAKPPLTLTFDLDPVDDQTHGTQQLSLFHGHYEQYQYLPLVVTCAEEYKCGMAMDRLSDHRFMANFFRLYLHAAALNLLEACVERLPIRRPHLPRMFRQRPYRNRRASSIRMLVVAATRWVKDSLRRGACFSSRSLQRWWSVVGAS